MGWWQKRSRPDIIMRSGGSYDFISNELRVGRMRVPVNLIDDLPRRIEGRGELDRHPVVQFLEHEIPGMAHSLYYWLEPASRGELIGEMLSSWTGGPRYADQEPEEDP